MRLPRFGLRALLVGVLLIGVVLAGWDYAQMRRREVEIRDKYEQLLSNMQIDTLYTNDLFLRIKTLQSVVDQHGLTAEAEQIYDAEREKERRVLREHSYDY